MWEAVLGEAVKALAVGAAGGVKDLVAKRLARRRTAQDVEALLADPAGAERAVRELVETDPEFAERLQEILAGDGTGVRDVPGSPAHFVDRDRERRSASGPGVHVITGPRGAGKSALVYRLADDLRDRYPDQVYVDLADYRDGTVLRRSEVATRVLRALGVETNLVTTNSAELWAQYRSVTARRRFLLALDNAEVATDVRELIPSSPSSLVLVTAIRQDDDLLAGNVAPPIELDSLERDFALELLGKASDPAAIEAERDAAAELAALCDHMPFALVQAGVRIRKRLRRGPGAVASVLADFRRTGVLGGVDVIAMAFEQSFAELSAGAAELCELLASHPGPDFTTASATAVFGAPAGDALDELTDAGFLAPTGTPRQRLFNLIREGARRRGARDVATDRALVFFRDQAVAADHRTSPDRLRCYEPVSVPAPDFEGKAPLDWVEDARETYGALAFQAFERERDVELGQICGALEVLMLNRGHHRLFAHINHFGLLAARRHGEPALTTRILSQQGRTYFLLHDFDRAQPLLEEALETVRTLDNPALESSVQEFCGRFHEEKGLLPAAADFLWRAVTLDRAMAEAGRRSLGIHTRMLANVLLKAGAYEHVWALLAESAQQFPASDSRNLGRVSMVRAKYLRAVGHYDDAERELLEAWRLVSGATQYTAEFEEEFGRLFAARGDHGRAHTHFQRAWQTYFDAGHPREAEFRSVLANTGRR
ncbi:ATP-binding protein [Amycolatopsis roodepoortensis]|uniref:ATP-binding protein n=1 Tax=Amycolatopsis roodepoortensis TaxID=700274 RepID=UPI00214B4731|nr:ATP-binding protein [Amycolatopsis roodepoortensis]UUV28349.1 ATP-binding protein [Amycolatopsis roodepoortensis]